MSDYNDPFEQTGPVPIFDVEHIARVRRERRKPLVLTCQACGRNADESGCPTCAADAPTPAAQPDDRSAS